MYCPSCGSQNLADIKFCTRCGTNLAIVSEALTEKRTNKSQPDERMVKLLKNYYDGRRSTAVGGVSLTVGLTILTLLMGAGMPEKWLVFGLLGLACLIYGAIVTIAGAAGWIQSSSEMKALGIASSLRALPRAELIESNSESAAAANYDTDPITSPASVTEHTTRQLEESTLTPRLENRSGSKE